MSQIIAAVPGYDVDFTPLRMGEYTLLDRGGLSLLLLALTLLAGGTALIGRRGVGRRVEPSLLWIGWPALVKVLVVAIILPTSAFVAWTMSPLGGRDLGLQQRPGLVAGYAVLGIVVLSLLLSLGARAVGRRARELGLTKGGDDAGGRAGGWFPAAAVIAAGATLGLLTAWLTGTESVGVGGWVGLMIPATLLWAAACAWVIRLRKIERWPVMLRRAVLIAASIATTLTAMVWIPSFYMDPVSDADLLRWLTLAGAAPLAGALSLMWLARQPGRAESLARATVRSLTPVIAAGCLAAAMLWGPLLTWREARLAQAMVEQSPTFVDLEVERSDGKELRAWLAGAELGAPKLGMLAGSPRPPRLEGPDLTGAVAE